jgi:ubiquinone/menaquinone biosynthesis C-methylase UbiE
MLTRADRRARKAGRAVDLRLMDVTDLKLPDRSFDAAFASFLFCVLPEEQQEPAVREIARVLKPGGTLRLLEYVRPTGAVNRSSRACGSPEWLGRMVLGSTA